MTTDFARVRKVTRLIYMVFVCLCIASAMALAKPPSRIAAATKTPPAPEASAAASDAPTDVKPIVVGTHRIPPFVIANADGTWSGISIDLWKRVAEEQKIPYTIKEVEVPALLAPETNGLDAVVSLNISAKSEGVLDMTHSFYTTGLAIATRAEPNSDWLSIASKVFSLKFLKGIGILILVVVGMGFLVWRVESKSMPDDFGGSPTRGIAHGMWWTVEALFGKGKSLSRTPVARLLTLGWVIITTLLVSGVTAKLSSELTVGQLSTTCTGPNDLPKVKVGVTAVSAAARYLEDRGIPYRVYPDYAAMLQGLAQRDVDAIIGESPILRYEIAARHPGTIVTLPGTFQNHGYGFGLRSGSPLREGVNTSLLRIAESDEGRRLVARYLGGLE